MRNHNAVIAAIEGGTEVHCSECRHGHLHIVEDRGIECDNCGRWWSGSREYSSREEREEFLQDCWDEHCAAKRNPRL